MKKLFSFVVLTILLFAFIHSCKKSEDSDLTKSVTGKYVGSNVEITVNKIDNSTVSVLVKPKDYCYDKGLGFTNVKMNSETSFTLNEITYNVSSCSKKISGTGTASGNNISVFATIVTDNLGLTCCFNKNESETYSGTK